MKKTIFLALTILALNINAQTKLFNGIKDLNINGIIPEKYKEYESEGINNEYKLYKNFKIIENNVEFNINEVCTKNNKIFSISVKEASNVYEYLKKKNIVYAEEDDTYIKFKTNKNILATYDSDFITILNMNEYKEYFKLKKTINY